MAAQHLRLPAELLLSHHHDCFSLSREVNNVPGNSHEYKVKQSYIRTFLDLKGPLNVVQTKSLQGNSVKTSVV